MIKQIKYVNYKVFYILHKKQSLIIFSLKEQQGLKKIPGITTLIAYDQIVDISYANDPYSNTPEFKNTMENMLQKMKQHGYIPDTQWVFQNLPEDIKQYLLCLHR